ncbi:MAG: MerR family transcriptional regulator [Gordonia sp. (in: high G+C Gram-positive bacteria)]|uniref:MerR family transcriptional regulator n=1 Tax=Gordonia sp. (in: high G+C Gram-positive bacteria) TaxID=84139 RepID=UPI003C708D66
MRIGELSRRSGVSARMLRHYDELGLVRPGDRSSAGYREYSETDLARLFQVETLRTLGLSLREIGQALEQPAASPAALLAALIARTRERIAREQALLTRLRQLDDAGPDDWEQVLSVLELLSGLTSPSAGRRQLAALDPATVGDVSDALVEALHRETDPNVAGALRWALARRGGAVTAVVEDLVGPDAERRRTAAGLLVEVPPAVAADHSYRAALLAALDDPDPLVRRDVATAAVAAGMDDDAVVDVLVALIVDGVADVAAAESLAVLADDPDRTAAVTGRLVAELSGARPPVRSRVAQALGELPGAAATDALSDLRNDPDDAVRYTARYLLDQR